MTCNDRESSDEMYERHRKVTLSGSVLDTNVATEQQAHQRSQTWVTACDDLHVFSPQHRRKSGNVSDEEELQRYSGSDDARSKVCRNEHETNIRTGSGDILKKPRKYLNRRT